MPRAVADGDQIAKNTPQSRAIARSRSFQRETGQSNAALMAERALHIRLLTVFVGNLIKVKVVDLYSASS